MFLFGPPCFEQDALLATIHERKAIALLVYLAVSGARHSRDTLATMFWPNQSQSRARASLRHALWSLKVAGLGDYLDLEHEKIGIHPPYWLDITEFNRLLEEHRQHGHAPGVACPACITSLRDAITLYKDDFLSGFTLRNAPQFDEWQYYQREHYQQMLAFALERLALWHSQQGEWAQTIEVTRRWVAIDPLNEPAQRWLMRAYVGNNQRHLAIKQYRTLKRMLDEELGTAPDIETRRLAEAVRSDNLETIAWEPSTLEKETHKPAHHYRLSQLDIESSARFLERGSFIEKLAKLLAEIKLGQGRMVFLGAEAGGGKTSLIRHFCAGVRRTARVLVGICDPLSTPQPLGPLWDIAVEVGGNLTRLIHDGEKPEHIFHAFLDELRNDRNSHLVIFEDVHWSDEASLDLLRFIGRRIESTHALVIASFREDEIEEQHPLRKLLGDLATATGIERLHLPPLSRQAVGVLVAGSGLDPDAVYRRTGGNPFFVTEMLASGIDRIPVNVRDAVLVRAARLPLSARSVLDSAAVIGLRVEVSLLVKMTGAEAAAIDECMSGGLLQAHGDGVEFRHELARQAVLEAISPPRLLLLHRQALEALRGSVKDFGDLARLAHHAEGARDDKAVLEYAPAAARQASAAGAHRQAAAQYERALRFAPELQLEERAHLLQAYARECFLCDRISTALQALEEAAQLWQETGNRMEEGSNLSLQANCLYLVGRYVQANQANRSAIEILSAFPTSPQLAQVYCQQARFLLYDDDYGTAVSLGKKAIDLGERIGDVQTLIRAHNVIGSLLIYCGEAGGQAHLERSIALAKEVHDHIGVAMGYCNLGLWVGRIIGWDSSDHYIAKGLAHCAEFELDFHNLYLLAMQANAQLYQGYWMDAEKTSQSILSQQDVSSDTRFWSLNVLGRLYARRGDPRSYTTLAEALELAEQYGILMFLASARAAQAEAAWLAGEPDRTREEVRAVYDLAVTKHHIWYTGELAFWLWRAGEMVDLPDWAMPVFATQIRGDWAAAAAEWQRRGCPYEHAWALADGDRAAQLSALEIFRRLGARPAMDFVQQKTQAVPLHRLEKEKFGGLTAREREVAALIVQGKSNREIAETLSVAIRTAETYVSRILNKLGYDSRVQIATWALEQGLAPLTQSSDV